MVKGMEYPDNLIKAIFGDVEGYNTAPDLLGSIEYCLYTLTDREREVINRRFKQHMTYEEVGRVFNVTRSRIGQISNKAMRKLRHPSRSKLIEYGLNGFIEIRSKLIIDEVVASDETIKAKMELTIDELDIPHQAYCCLRRAKLFTVKDILSVIQDGSLLNVRNIGLTTAKEVVNAIRKIGLNTDVEEVSIDDV